ncbi:hypothetical protein OG413_08280 [Streptomyces sp. NBC_01433]|uniref:hypothetical protein n=1 Tax=Streptomyces sp. NBC_01433 TaxID=2903864 RepID=UPI002251D178|nr:hypothetical protein [Streptomyces sp. NBC_01433]MCX4675320.1 hypothetical protein [Streptomyces sp. NBC_01433]
MHRTTGFAAGRYLTVAARLGEQDDELADLPAYIADMLAEDRRQRDEHRFNGGVGHIDAKPQTAAQAAAVLALAARLLTPRRGDQHPPPRSVRPAFGQVP